MEEGAAQQPVQSQMPVPETCPACHQGVLSTYYFCPNCGTKLQNAPLPTSSGAQLKLYAFSIILPLICFITISKWRGIQYLRSKDEQTRSIGFIACFLLLASTLILIWLTYVWTQNAIQQSITSINADMSI
jgi:hypothetical protein